MSVVHRRGKPACQTLLEGFILREKITLRILSANGSDATAIAEIKKAATELKVANTRKDAGVVDTQDGNTFIAAAKTRQWEREKEVRTLT